MISMELKNELMKEYATHDGDTGSASVQIAVLTARVQDLTEHLKEHKKDFSTRRGLLKLVGRRRRLLTYLKKKDLKAYSELIGRLGLRK